MIVEQAEELVCPFMSNAQTADKDGVNRWKIHCITTKCMAWRITRDEATDDRLLPHECEGYCMRLYGPGED